jgi:hypothetical protein
MPTAIWRWLGFGPARALEPPQDAAFPELMYVPLYFDLPLVARIRILVSGKINISLTARTKVKVDSIVPAASITVLPPNYRGFSDARLANDGQLSEGSSGADVLPRSV